jgi:hypothetical protein
MIFSFLTLIIDRAKFNSKNEQVRQGKNFANIDNAQLQALRSGFI